MSKEILEDLILMCIGLVVGLTAPRILAKVEAEKNWRRENKKWPYESK
jgi:uncharacterized protein YbbK (DUF523 family)